MEHLDPAWLESLQPRKGTPAEHAVKGAFQYNGGHGLTTFFVDVQLAQSLQDQLADQGLSPADTVSFVQQEQGDWVAAFADEAMEKRVEYALSAQEMEELMSRNGLHLVHV